MIKSLISKNVIYYTQLCGIHEILNYTVIRTNSPDIKLFKNFLFHLFSYSYFYCDSQNEIFLKGRRTYS